MTTINTPQATNATSQEGAGPYPSASAVLNFRHSWLRATALHRENGQEIRVSLAIVIGTNERSREPRTNRLAFGFVQGDGIWNRLAKCCVQCSAEHHQCFWIVGRAY
jgi:hypothetical protein